MISLWIMLMYLMADVIGHGGDGAGDPPRPPFGWPGSHEMDAVPPRKTRGKAKNKKLGREIKKQGRPLVLPFDRDATYLPVGELNDMFVREVGIYMDRNYAFEKRSWVDLSEAKKNQLEEHMKQKFDYDAILRDRESARLTGGIHSIYLKSYREHKTVAKRKFLAKGGYENLEQARANPPEGMDGENWRKTIEHFLSEGHRKASEANKANRQKQHYVNRGGSATYSSYCFKQDKSRLEAFLNAHTRKDGTFDSELAEQQYNELKEQLESQIQAPAEEGGSSTPNVVAIFESVLGSRRGHARGIGRKPPASATSRSIDHEQQQEQNQTRQTRSLLTQEQLDDLFEDPRVVAKLSSFFHSNKAPNQNEDDDANEEDD